MEEQVLLAPGVEEFLPLVSTGSRAALDLVPLALKGMSDLAPDICHDLCIQDHLSYQEMDAPSLPDMPVHDATNNLIGLLSRMSLHPYRHVEIVQTQQWPRCPALHGR